MASVPPASDPVEHAVFDQPGAEHDGVGRGGAGCADGADHIAEAEADGDLLGAVAAIVGQDEIVVRRSEVIVPVVDLGLVHPANGAGGNDAGAEAVYLSGRCRHFAGLLRLR